MMRTILLSLTLFSLVGCDKSSPDSAPPDGGGGAMPTDGDDSREARVSDVADDERPEVAAELEPDEGSDTEPAPVVAESNGPSPVPADPAVGLTAPTSMATVKLEIKDDNGKVFKDTPKVIRFDEKFRIPVEIGSRVHEIDVEVSREGKGLEVVLGYLLAGQELVRNYRLETSANKRELIHIEGGIALAITVGSKTIKPKPQKERDKVQTPAGSDPLAGAER
jgi:hypothetical protein